MFNSKVLSLELSEKIDLPALKQTLENLKEALSQQHSQVTEKKNKAQYELQGLDKELSRLSQDYNAVRDLLRRFDTEPNPPSCEFDPN